jgi:hypothetical protein
MLVAYVYIGAVHIMWINCQGTNTIKRLIMKKIKVVLNSVAILVALGGAFATSYCKECEDHEQYIPARESYGKAGEYGIDYNCSVGFGACTFYYPDTVGRPGRLAPCREGLYTPVYE